MVEVDPPAQNITEFKIQGEEVKVDECGYLDLNEIAECWKSGQAFPQLIDFLKGQTHLEMFDFTWNNLTTLQTTQLLQCIAQSNKQLKKLYLYGSCNFDSDESVQALAQCIDQCRDMDYLGIPGQVGARKVQVVYTAGESISVVTQGTNDVLHSLPTTRSGEINIYWQDD